MFCTKCGAQLPENALFCGSCGTKVAAPDQPAYQAPAQPAYQAPAQPAAQPAQPVYQAPTQPVYAAPATNTEPHHGYVDFFEAFKLVFTNAINFTGRASKSEFWWGYLACSAIATLLAFIPYVGSFLAPALGLPIVSLMIRRFHDLSMPWQNIFKFLIPVYGIIYMIQTFLLPSVGDNEYGPGPR